ncbi:helix-turn-helix domain-containing protein [Limibacter armeniacum]|uniref:helix-turn-helix domain-containing protein n=1 Tax=Limibacter armeniacum TaxID=466084 RepID=UPI002FE6077B
MEFILTVAMTQASIASFLLWKGLYQQTAKKYLLYLLVLISLHLSIKFILLEVLQYELLFKYLVTSFAAAYGPLIYFYVRTEIRQESPSRLFHIIHFLPFLLLSVVYIGVLIHTYLEADIVLLKNYAQWGGSYIMLSSMIYVSYSMYLVQKSEVKEVKWILVPIVINMAAVFLINAWLWLNFHWVEDAESSSFVLRYIGYSNLLFFVFWILKHNTLSIGTHAVVEQGVMSSYSDITLEDRPQKKKYSKSGLKEEDAIRHMEQLKDLMEKDRLYLESELTLADLADKTGISKHNLTEVLNKQLGKTFYQFVNEYRIEEAKKQMASDKHDNLLQLALACGFNSKSTFNTYFKKIEGVPPSKYQVI